MAALDEILSLAEQDRWCNDLDYISWEGSRATDKQPELRKTALQWEYRTLYEQFMEMEYAADVINVLRAYVQKCVPAPLQSEYRFWQSTIFPASPRWLFPGRIIVRINAGQTIFEVGEHEASGEIYYAWYVQEPQLKRIFGLELKDKLRNQFHPDVIVKPPGLIPSLFNTCVLRDQEVGQELA